MNMENEFKEWCQNQRYVSGTTDSFFRYLKDVTLKDGRKIFEIDKGEFKDFIIKINLYEFLTNEKPDTVGYEIMDGIFNYSGNYSIEVQRTKLKQGLLAYLKFINGESYT